MAVYVLLLCLGIILNVATKSIQSKNIFSDSEATLEFGLSAPLRHIETDVGFPDIIYVTLFYESMCPACRKFDTTYFSELVSKLGQHIFIGTVAYGKASTTYYYNGTVTFWCQHGELECYGNKLHECSKVFLDYLEDEDLRFNSCLMEFDRSENGSNDDAVDECGAKMNINANVTTLIKKCAKGVLGSKLLQQAGKVSMFANYASLPHVVINDEHWTGKHEELIKDVCALFRNPPEACKDA